MQMILNFVIAIIFAVLVIVLLKFFPITEKYSDIKENESVEYYSLNPPTDVSCRTAGILCPAGNYCPAGASQPTPCLAGTYCPAGASQALPCPAGSYCIAGSVTPAPCPAGTYCSNTNTKALVDAIQCPAGTLCDIAGLSIPKDCPAGSFCPNMGTTSASACPAGSYCPLVCPPH